MILCRRSKKAHFGVSSEQRIEESGGESLVGISGDSFADRGSSVFI